MLAQLALQIKNNLIALPGTKWGVLKPTNPGDAINIEFALDPSEFLKTERRTIFVAPVNPVYDLDTSLKRGPRIQSLTKSYIVSIVITIPFKTFKNNDVASEEEITNFYELWEKTIDNVAGMDLGYNLMNIDAEPPVESELYNRNLIVMADFTYQNQKCV